MTFRTIRLAAGLMLAACSGGALATVQASATIDTARPGSRISPEIYGQFAEELGHGIDGGIWVGPGSAIPNINGYRKDVVDALRRLHVPVVRWPGGCYADTYHWQNGVGPRDRRPVTINYSWGGVEQRNAFGTSEFFDFAELIGAKTYLSVNLGSGTPQEARDWVEYITSPGHSDLAEQRRANGRAAPWKLDYVGLGNEMWGCGGNQTAEESSAIMRRFATYLAIGPKLIASGASDRDYHWTEVVMKSEGPYHAASPYAGLSLHYYTVPTGVWDHKGAAVGFPESEWASTLRNTREIEGMIARHEAIMDKADPARKIGLMVDEWGTWTDPSPGSNAAFLVQSNTLRDALVAATNFHIFHRHAARVQMANIAQMVNVLQAMIQTDGPRMALTPTYYAFQMYEPFQGATTLPLTMVSPDYVSGQMRLPAIDGTAARGTDGKIYIGLVNADPNNAAEVAISLAGRGTVSGQLLTGPAMDSRNDIGRPQQVLPQTFTGFRRSSGGLKVAMPAKSVVVLKIEP
ncbi:MAG: alpha-L-arabinofuranosidase C-terminal domain-containing protein [Sphingomicrobium sp.]